MFSLFNNDFPATQTYLITSCLAHTSIKCHSFKEVASILGQHTLSSMRLRAYKAGTCCSDSCGMPIFAKKLSQETKSLSPEHVAQTLAGLNSGVTMEGKVAWCALFLQTFPLQRVGKVLNPLRSHQLQHAP